MESKSSIADVLKNGLWDNNPGLIQLLGLCPLLAVTNTFINGLGLGLATLVVLTLSNTLVSLTRRFIRADIRIPMYVLIIASLVTCIELAFRAWFPALDRTLGIFIPLIVTNCAIVARAEAFASRNAVLPSFVDGVAMGAGFTALLCLLGAFRELLGYGTLFSGIDMLLGSIEPTSGIVFTDGGFLLALLPPGAFFGLALAIAGKNAWDQRRRRQARLRAGRAR